VLLFDVDRDEEGRPKLVLPAPEPPTAEQAFRRRCYLNGITDPARVRDLWADEKARLAALKGAGGANKRRARR